MDLSHKLLISVTPPPAVNVPQFPEENLLSTAAQGDGFFITRPGALLKDDRYQVVRKLGRGRYSSTFLVEDLQCSSLSRKYFAAKVLSADSTNALRNGLSHELECLQAVVDRPKNVRAPHLSILRDHFAERGPHGVHYCFLTDPLCSNVHALRASAPAGRLGVHIVKPIIACVVDGLRILHSLDIIHGDIKADNVLFAGPDTAEIEETIAIEPPLIDDTFEFNGEEYPILRSQTFSPFISWEITPYDAEIIQAILCDLGSALRDHGPKPSGDISAFSLRAPENIICAECDRKIDIWAIGCMTYELLTGQILFRSEPVADLTPDEHMLLFQYALTGETLSKEVVKQSRAKENYFDEEGVLIKSKSNPYPRQTFKELLTRHCNPDMTETRIDAAAKFIGDCLRLNPQDRPNANELNLHRWLQTAFMGYADHE